MNKKMLITKLMTKADIDYNTARDFVDHAIEAISTMLAQDEAIKITNFGTLKTIQQQARIGRNPHTKIEYIINSCTKIIFLPADNLKQKINNK